MRGQHAPLDYHRSLIDDPVRIAAWDRAIRAVVRAGDVVLDAGAGTGVLGMLAARCGARVHCVESAAIVDLAADLVRHNGLADRITVHRADLVEMPVIEPVDVVLFDFAGMVLNDRGTLEGVAAAGRWLRAGGRFLPARLRVRAAPAGGFLLQEVDRFDHPILGIDLEPAARAARRQAYRTVLDTRALLAGAADVGEITAPDVPLEVRFEAEWTAARPGPLDAIAVWVVSDLAPGVEIDTGPGVVTSWGQVLLPLPPRAIAAGDRIAVQVTMRATDTGVDFDWTGRATPGGSVVRTSVRPSSEELEARGERLHDGGRFTAALTELLAALDGDPTSRELASRLVVSCYARLGRRDQALAALADYESAFGPHPFVAR